MSSAHIAALESILRSNTARRDVELKTALARLSAEIRARLVRGSGRSINFIESSIKTLGRLKGGSNATVRMSCLCDGGQYLFSNGRSAEALIAGAHCEALARQVGNKDFLSKAQTLQSMANADLGNVAYAVIQSSSALEIALDIRHFGRQVASLINLGIALNYGGLYREAIPCFDRVIAQVHSDRNVAEVNELGLMSIEFELCALSNKSQSYYELGEFAVGFNSIDECLKKSPEPWDAISSERRAIREFMLVQFALELRKLAIAQEHARLCRRYGVGVTERAEFHARVAAALCEVHGGNATQGIAALERLYRQAEAAAYRLTVLNSLIRCYEEMGQPEFALERMNELLLQVRRQREAGITALISLGHAHSSERALQKDLDCLTVREANLRAKVAERRLVIERIDMFERFAVTADLKEDQSGQHGYRVGRLSALTALRVGWKTPNASTFELAARLHDIGKIAVPDRILLSTAPLPQADKGFIAAHTTIGSELLSHSELPHLRIAKEIARHHHEWWDGTGYPSKLSGKRIPIHARIVALADVFDALTHGRPYSPPWSIDRALEEIKSKRGTQFDPDLTDAFVALIEDLRREHDDLDSFLGEASRHSPFLQAREKIRAMLEGGCQTENIAAAIAETVH
jgi:putative two-component system response regulator